jgi:hypothetical protein
VLVVGIDEAGYGPKLGPLVIGLVAVRLAPGEEPLARRLSGLVVRRPRRLRRPLPVPVDDSKTIHRRFGREGLVRAAALHAAARDRTFPTRFGPFLDGASDVPCAHFATRPWYANLASVAVPAHPPLPALRARFEARGVEAVALRVRPVDAADLNAGFDRTGNKASVLGLAAGETLLAFLETVPDRDVAVRFDRQGGRLDYGAYLGQLFPFANVLPRPAPRGEAHYEVRLPDRRIEVRFVTHGDQKHLTVAWASTAAKLTRELVMDALNAWFTGRAPGVQPTAGYHQDGLRFLAEVEPVLAAEGILPHTFVRAR